jgi:hypothetical protein
MVVILFLRIADSLATATLTLKTFVGQLLIVGKSGLSVIDKLSSKDNNLQS